VAWDSDEANNLFLVDRIEDNSLSLSHTHKHTYIPSSIRANQLCNNQVHPSKIVLFKVMFSSCSCSIFGCT
jgi:hypothetical protein